MARNDGIDRTLARNQDLETPDDVTKVQEHNEREKDRYSNVDIVPERTALNVHFKSPTDDYVKMFEQMEQDKIISTRGLKPDAVKYGELVFDVNSTYFYNHGGYEFAKQFYADAYKAAVEIVGGEQYILSAVMHADERNRAMSEALGEDVYHYHLHVVYIPVVEKQILWSKRCKDESLRGTVKETITQVSRSKKWESKPVLDENGNPMLNAKGKKILKSSYSVLQDDFFNFMRNAGYTDVERGECGSTEEHLTVTQFKVQAEQQRLEAVTGQVAQAEQSLADGLPQIGAWLELDEILCFKGFFYLCGNLRKCTAVHHQHNSIILVRIGGILIETCDSKRNRLSIREHQRNRCTDRNIQPIPDVCCHEHFAIRRGSAALHSRKDLKDCVICSYQCGTFISGKVVFRKGSVDVAIRRKCSNILLCGKLCGCFRGDVLYHDMPVSVFVQLV